MKLDQYIKELLIEKDSIIIKDFGAFEKVLQSAEIDEDSGEIKPPHVTLKFDPSLKIDSGTLSKYIAAKEGISEEEATKKIAEQVKVWENELKEGKSIHLAGIGFIKLDKGTKIFIAKIAQGIFPDMYGLPVITVEKQEEKLDVRKQPIRKEPPKKKETVKKEEKTVENKVPEKKKPVKKTKSTPKKVKTKEEKEKSEKAFKKLMLTLLILVPIIIIGVLAALNFDLVKEKFNSGSKYVSGLLSGEENDKTEVNTNEIDNKDTNQIAEIDNLDSTISNENETQKILENYTVINGQTNETVSAGEQVSQGVNIEIIAGSFKSMQNAKRYRNQLKNKGFSAKVLPKANGLYRVSIGSFNDLQAAGAEIENLHEIDPTLNVWILLNK